MEFNPKDITAKVKDAAAEAGFFQAGIAKAEFLSKDAESLGNWLANDYHGEMLYMGNNVEKRNDPRKLVENARSVIVFLYNYYPAQMHFVQHL